MTQGRSRLVVAAALAAAMLGAAALGAAPRCGRAPVDAGAPASPVAAPRPAEATIVTLGGTVERRARGAWVPARVGETLRTDDAIRTRAGAHADLVVDDDARLTVTESTELSVRTLADAVHRFGLSRGRVAVDYRGHGGRVLRIESADGRAVAQAPEARFSVLATGLTFAVATETGVVDLSAAGHTVHVGAGRQATVAAAEPPGDPVPIPAEVLLKVAERSRVDGACDGFQGDVAPGSEVTVDGAPADVTRAGRFSVRGGTAPAGAGVRVSVRDAAGHARSRVVRCRERTPTDVDVRWVDAPAP